MTDHSELKRLAEAATPGPWYQHGGIMQVLSHDCETVCETFEDDGECPDAQFIAAANPAAVLALIAENERLTNRLEVDPRHDYDGISTRDATVKVLDEQVDQLRAEVQRLNMAVGIQTVRSFAGQTDQKSIDELLAAGIQVDKEEIARLRAEIAGLKTGYQAYERVNAELKAEVEGLRKDAERWRFFSVLANDLQAFPHAWGKMTPEKMDAMCDQAMADAALGQGEQS